MYDEFNVAEEEIGHQTSSRPSNAWLVTFLVTFTDLVSLMLTFFVMLFAMSSVKIDRWDEMIDALSTSLNPTKTESVVASTAQFNIGTIFRRRAVNLDYLASILEEGLARDPILHDALLMNLEDRLVIALPGELLFEPGRAIMTEGARQAMFSLGGVMRNVGNEIAVDGHTDPAPPVGGTYDSNWELSLARAVAVANSLRRSGYPDEIVANGYAGTRYDMLPDVSAERRRALGRRVDIVVLATGGRG